MAYWRIRLALSVLKNGAKYLQTKGANSLTMCLLPHLLTYNKKPKQYQQGDVPIPLLVKLVEFIHYIRLVLKVPRYVLMVVFT
jgi:hypothetical protein